MKEQKITEKYTLKKTRNSYE